MKEREISLRNLLVALWEGKFIIAIFAISFFVIVLGGSLVYDNSNTEVSTIIQLRWDEASEGVYPDGTPFVYADSIEPQVIEAAISYQGLNLSGDAVRQAMEIVPIVPNDVVNQIQQSLEDGEEYTYYATSLRINIDSSLLDITIPQTVSLLDRIVTEFGQYFEERYTEESVILDFTGTDFTELEYPEIIKILESQIELIKVSLEDNSSIDYRSSNEYTFNDILTLTELVERVELEQIETRSYAYSLTKDANYLETYYAYEIAAMNLELDRLVAMYADNQVLIDNYDGSITQIIIPGTTTTEDLIIETYYDDLVLAQSLLADEIASKELDIATYEVQLNRLQGNDPDFLYTITQKEEQVLEVEVYITQALDKLEDIIDEASLILSEYYEFEIDNDIIPLSTAEHQSNVNTVTLSIIGCMIGFGIGAVVVLFRHDWK